MYRNNLSLHIKKKKSKKKNHPVDGYEMADTKKDKVVQSLCMYIYCV